MRSIPESAPRYGANRSETALFEALQQQAGDTDWVVLHSIKLGADPEVQAGETDFYVLIPGSGIVAIEAKAPTSVEYHGGDWVLVGTPNPKKNPFDQVNRARAVLRRFLINHDLPESIPIARLVWLTSLEPWKFDPTSTGDIQFQSWELAWRSDLKHARVRIEEVIESHNRHFKSSGVITEDPSLLTESVVQQITAAMFNDFSVEISPEEIRIERQRSLREATADQIEILDAVSQNLHLYLEGSAGSGKSFLLAELARRAKNDGKRVLLCCWNKMMAEDLAKQLPSGEAGLGASFRVVDINSLMLEFAGMADNPADADSEWYEQKLPALALANLKHKQHLANYSVLLIDEFQDLKGKVKVLEFVLALGKGGAVSETQIVLAGDDRQSILVDQPSQASGFELAKLLIPDFAHVRLSQNCRMTPSLHRSMSAYLGLDLGVSKHRLPNDKTGGLTVIPVADGEEATKLQSVLRDLLEHYLPDEIRILSPFGAKRSLAGRVVAENGRSNVKKWLVQNLKSPDSPGRIRWRSIPKFKGLESEVVVITDINRDSVEFADSIGHSFEHWIYVGVSRARHRCIVLQQEGLDWRAYQRELKIQREVLANLSGEPTS